MNLNFLLKRQKEFHPKDTLNCLQDQVTTQFSKTRKITYGGLYLTILKTNFQHQKKNQIIEPFINVSTAKLLEKIYRESLVIELLWEEKIDYELDNSIAALEEKKISFFKIVKKYLSKRIRSFYK